GFVGSDALTEELVGVLAVGMRLTEVGQIAQGRVLELREEGARGLLPVRVQRARMLVVAHGLAQQALPGLAHALLRVDDLQQRHLLRGQRELEASASAALAVQDAACYQRLEDL